MQTATQLTTQRKGQDMTTIEETIQDMTEQKGFKQGRGTSKDNQKQLSGKPIFFNRVDVSACIDPVARVRSAAIDDIKKYPESMAWPDVDAWRFIDAIQSHLKKIYKAGNPYAVDKETGCFHLDAIAFNHMVCEMKRTDSERELSEGEK